jgi:GNAT superfamily N-acetyltransferase
VSKPAVTIRLGQPDDLAALTSLLEELFSIEEDFCFDQSNQMRGLGYMLNNQGGRLLTAEADGQVVGMCSGQLLISTAEGGPSVLVEDVVVGRPWRGKGVGSRLMQAVGLWAEENGASRLQLLADRANASAIAFYEHLGWQRTNLICLRKMMS